MFRFLLVFGCFAFASAGIRHENLNIIVAEPQNEIFGFGDKLVGLTEAVEGKSFEPKGDLTHLAHSSAIQAESAVRDQQILGRQAAFGVRSGLAFAARRAAATAQAAQVGRQAIVDNFKERLEYAEERLHDELAQYQQSRSVVAAAQQAAQEVQQQVNALTAALANTQVGAQRAQQAAAEAAGAAAAQNAMIHEAEQRVTNLSEQLHNAQAELQETELSAQKAAAAAQDADNVLAIAAHNVAQTAADNNAALAADHYHH